MMTLNDILKIVRNGTHLNAIRTFNLAPRGVGSVPSVKALAERLGFSVTRKSLPNGISGRLVTDPFSENGYCIEVNENESVVRQRWTVLHEIGHFYLHVDRSDPFAPAKLRDRFDPFYLENELKEEREADCFAAALLFDHGALSAARTLFNNDVELIARHFGMSQEVVRIGLRQFT